MKPWIMNRVGTVALKAGGIISEVNILFRDLRVDKKNTVLTLNQIDFNFVIFQLKLIIIQKRLFKAHLLTLSLLSEFLPEIFSISNILLHYYTVKSY